MHKSFSFKALRDSLKTEKQLLTEKIKEETKEKIQELIETNKINEIDLVHGTALNRAITIKDKKIILALLDKHADTIQSLLFLTKNYTNIKEIKQFVDVFLQRNFCVFLLRI